MTMSEWARMCQGAESIAIDEKGVMVELSNGRRHRILVRDQGDSYEFTAVVARPKALEKINDISLQAWKRNRAAQLVGFRIDSRGRLVGESWVPKTGLDADEFCLYIRRIAAECDHFEYVLTGQDRE
ncbi:MAG TPA: hypothetical protein PK749_01765 [Deltaproteobacteria bacterium]|nr:hypothetical protein [Deltaproteobacteria bacterium]HOY73866.1 hypothetical protein [Deltaproteobacteria bacterium]